MHYLLVDETLHFASVTPVSPQDKVHKLQIFSLSIEHDVFMLKLKINKYNSRYMTGKDKISLILFLHFCLACVLCFLYIV